MLSILRKVKRKGIALRNKLVIQKPTPWVTNLTGRNKLKLNLGSNCEVQAGFVNIDFSAGCFNNIPPGSLVECMVYDLSKGIPADNASTTYIYSSHFFEHIEYFDLKKLISECFRVLESGGVMRIAMPNMPNVVRAYQERDMDFFKWAVNEKTEKQYRAPLEEIKWADMLSLALYEWGEHKYFYDAEKLHDMLQRAGFTNIKEVDFDPLLDLQSRYGHTFYISAEKA